MASVSRDGENRRLFGKLAFVACAMFGFGYALVPFYNQICEATGLNNLLQPDAVARNTQVDTGRWLTIELDANINNLPWQFASIEKSVRVHPGELVQVTYEVRNTSARPVAGQAIPSYGPQLAQQYFRKLECFCFAKQVLAPGETRRMPVVFVVDPGLPREVTTVTLSYTFFEINGATAAAGAADAG